MSSYPDVANDFTWLRDRVLALESEVREARRGPRGRQTLVFDSYAAMVAVVGAPLQWAYVSDGVPGRVGPWRYFPGLGWQRDWDTGEVVAYTGSVAPKWSLPASGGTYNVSDYPDLAARYGVSSGKFVVRNLGGRVLVGAGTVADANGTIRTFAQGDTGGELTHVLSVPELPAHSHGVNDPGHLHSMNQGGYNGTGNWSAVGAGNQYPNNALVNANVTGISIQPTGSNVAHNNLQPFSAMPLAIRI